MVKIDMDSFSDDEALARKEGGEEELENEMVIEIDEKWANPNWEREREEKIRKIIVMEERIRRFEKEEKKTLDEILEMLELMKKSAEDEVVDISDIKRVMEVMISEEIVTESLNLKEEHIKA